jgi:predicted RNase H-like HicB family nuclease
MYVKVVVYEAAEGGYWAKVPALPGCVTQGETIDEVKQNIAEAVGAYLEVAEEVALEEDQNDADADSHRVQELKVAV